MGIPIDCNIDLPLRSSRIQKTAFERLNYEIGHFRKLISLRSGIIKDMFFPQFPSYPLFELNPMSLDYNVITALNANENNTSEIINSNSQLELLFSFDFVPQVHFSMMENNFPIRHIDSYCHGQILRIAVGLGSYPIIYDGKNLKIGGIELASMYLKTTKSIQRSIKSFGIIHDSDISELKKLRRTLVC